MEKRLSTTIWFGVITASLTLFSAFDTTPGGARKNHQKPSIFDNKLQKAAFEILDAKCNVCHRKQNPFMVFKEKNISKRAKKIYRMVFAERRMPKGNEIRLTYEEYATLEKWLFTQEIF